MLSKLQVQDCKAPLSVARIHGSHAVMVEKKPIAVKAHDKSARDNRIALLSIDNSAILCA